MSGPEKTVDFVKYGGEETLSMKVLVELLSAVTEKGKPFRFQVHGSSMYPCIKDLDIITISPLSSGHPRMGDVVAFISPGTEKLVVHRVVGWKENKFLIRGDNAPKSDGQIPEVQCAWLCDSSGKEL